MYYSYGNVIKQKTRVNQFLSFSTEYHLLRLLSQIRIKNHFPLKNSITQLLIIVSSLRKVAALEWMSSTTENRRIVGKKFAM